LFFAFCSGSDSISENSGNLAHSGSSDLNQMSIDTNDRNILNMTKKRDSNSKDNEIPTYSDGSINYDGIIYKKMVLLFRCNFHKYCFLSAIYEDQDESDGKKIIINLKNFFGNLCL